MKNLFFSFVQEKGLGMQLVEVDERFKSYFHDYKMNLIEIMGNTSYNFREEDVHNL